MPNRRNAIYTLIILSFAAGYLTGRAFFFNLTYLFAALLFVTWMWSLSGVSNVRINRTTRARRTQVGKTLDEYFTVRSGSFLPKLWLEVRDHSNLPGHRASAIVPTLMPRSTFRWTVQTTCTLRGEFTMGPMTLVSGDPFGFFQSVRHIPATSSILVYPAIFPLRDFALPSGVLSGGEAQRQRAPFVTTNASGVREYFPGDSFNRIHWRSTARRDRLMVKEFELDPLADIWLMLDLSATTRFAHSLNADLDVNQYYLPPDSGEYAIAAAASIAAYFLGKDRAFGFATYNPHRTVFSPERGSRQLTRILEALALARIEAEISFSQLVAYEGHHLGRGTTAILISADPTDAWIGEAQLIIRRGVRVIAVLPDPHSFGSSTVRGVNETQALLESFGAITYIIKQGDNLSTALSGSGSRLFTRPVW